VLYVCMYVCVCIYVCMYVCMWVWMHACIYVCMYPRVCVYACVPISTHVRRNKLCAVLVLIIITVTTGTFLLRKLYSLCFQEISRLLWNRKSDKTQVSLWTGVCCYCSFYGAKWIQLETSSYPLRFILILLSHLFVGSPVDLPSVFRQKHCMNF
jgi:hypothetical protein